MDSPHLTHTRLSALRLGVAAATATAGVALARTAAHAQNAKPEVSTARQTVTLAAAQAMIAAGLAKAQEIGVPMALAVVDESGVLKAFARMDGNSLASVDLVQAKAYTAAAFRAPTHVLAERNAGDPTRLASLPNFPRVTLLGGGYPIMAGGMVVGGVAAGGGSAQQDQDVAEAALAAVA